MAFISTPFIGLPLSHSLAPPRCTRPAFSTAVKTARRPSRAAPIAPTLCEQKSDEETVSMQELQARLQDAQEAAATDAQPDAQAEGKNQQQDDEDDYRTEKQKENDRLRAAEKFIRIDEGKFECPACAYLYDPEKGDPRNKVPKGTAFEDLPDMYTCPTCRTPARRFFSQKKVIAGFADNQIYGFGSNSMTGGAKSLLIFGGLVVCALILLSGYALN